MPTAVVDLAIGHRAGEVALPLATVALVGMGADGQAAHTAVDVGRPRRRQLVGRRTGDIRRQEPDAGVPTGVPWLWLDRGPIVVAIDTGGS